MSLTDEHNGEDPEEPVYFSIETVAVYLTVVARGVRWLDQVYGFGASDRFIQSLDESLEVEASLSGLDEHQRLVFTELQKMLGSLVRNMPSHET